MVKVWQSRQNMSNGSTKQSAKQISHTILSRHCATPNHSGTKVRSPQSGHKDLGNSCPAPGTNTVKAPRLIPKPASLHLAHTSGNCKAWLMTWLPRTKNKLSSPWLRITPDLVLSSNTAVSHHIQKPKSMCQPSWTVHKSISLRIALPLAAQKLATLGLVNGLTHCPVARRRPVLVPAHAPQEQSVISTPQIMVVWTSPLVAAQPFSLQPIWKSPRPEPTNTKANTSLDA